MLFPNNDPQDWRTWIERTGTKNPGDLTSKGIQDCYKVGKDLKRRYISGEQADTKIRDISASYSPLDYHFRSSDYERTLISQYSIGTGLFEHQGTDTTLKQFNPFESVSMQEHNDLIVHGFKATNCPAVINNKELFLGSADVKAEIQKLLGDLKPCADALGVVVDEAHKSSVFTYQVLWMYAHGMISNAFVKDHIQDIYRVRNGMTHLLHNPKCYQNLGAQGLLSHVLSNMDAITENRKKYVTQNQYERQNYFKFVHYSGHDTTLYSIFSALLLHNYTYTNPPLGSAFIFELHRDTTVAAGAENLFVKLFFRAGPTMVDSPTALPYFAEIDMSPLRCGGVLSCPYSAFKASVQAMIPPDFCSSCQNYRADICIRKYLTSKNTQITVLGTIIVMFGLLEFVAGILIFVLFVEIQKKAKRVMTNQDFGPQKRLQNPNYGPKQQQQQNPNYTPLQYQKLPTHDDF